MGSGTSEKNRKTGKSMKHVWVCIVSRHRAKALRRYLDGFMWLPRMPSGPSSWLPPPKRSGRPERV